MPLTRSAGKPDHQPTAADRPAAPANAMGKGTPALVQHRLRVSAHAQKARVAQREQAGEARQQHRAQAGDRVNQHEGQLGQPVLRQGTRAPAAASHQQALYQNTMAAMLGQPDVLVRSRS